jgi:hypothetical protein
LWTHQPTGAGSVALPNHLDGTPDRQRDLDEHGAGLSTETFFTNNTARDVTIVLAGVPTLPQWALIALTVCLALAGVAALRRRAR